MVSTVTTLILFQAYWVFFFLSIFQSVQFTSVSQSCPTLRPHESHAARQASLSSSTPAVYSNSCPSSRWCHLAISSSIVPFSSCSQSLPASGSFPMSQLFAWGGQSTGVSASASVLPSILQATVHLTHIFQEIRLFLETFTWYLGIKRMWSGG